MNFKEPFTDFQYIRYYSHCTLEINVYGFTNFNINIIFFKFATQFGLICTNLPPLVLDNQPIPCL